MEDASSDLCEVSEPFGGVDGDATGWLRHARCLVDFASPGNGPVTGGFWRLEGAVLLAFNP
jgi:hypothetical protein